MVALEKYPDKNKPTGLKTGGESVLTPGMLPQRVWVTALLIKAEGPLVQNKR